MWCEIDLSALVIIEDIDGETSAARYSDQHFLINLERVSHVHKDLKFQKTSGEYTHNPRFPNECEVVWGIVFCDGNKIMKTIWSKNEGLINKIFTQVINFISEHKITGYFKFTDDDLDSEETPF